MRLVFWLGKGRKRKVKETGLEVEFVLGWKTERRVGAWFRKRRGSVETLRRVKRRAFVKVEATGLGAAIRDSPEISTSLSCFHSSVFLFFLKVVHPMFFFIFH